MFDLEAKRADERLCDLISEYTKYGSDAMTFGDEFTVGLRSIYLSACTPEVRSSYETSEVAMAYLMRNAERAAGTVCAALMIDTDPECQRYCDEVLERAAHDEPDYALLLKLTFVMCLEAASEQGFKEQHSAKIFQQKYFAIRELAAGAALQ